MELVAELSRNRGGENNLTMRIKCIANMGADLPADCLDPASGFDPDTVFDLIIGKEYVVYGITLFLGYVWYYICDEVYIYYPIWNPSPLFEVVDGRLSRYWSYGFYPGSTESETHVIFGYEEWVNDPYHYDKLTDGEEVEVAIFRRYKELMDLEFPDPSLSKVATNLGDGWLMCPDCDEAWETSSSDGMVRCPKCRLLMNNPLLPG